MKLKLAKKNIFGRPFRSLGLILMINFLAFTLMAGTLIILSLKKGLNTYKERLGADVIVVPQGAVGESSVDDILLQGIAANSYMSGDEYEKICGFKGIDKMSRQFYLTSAQADCCSSKIQIIGIDTESDFVIKPWIDKSYSKKINYRDIIIGSEVSSPSNGILMFYGNEYRVVAKLKKTGTGLDNAVFTSMETIEDMALDYERLMATDTFSGIDIKSAASAVMIRVADGARADAVAVDINNHVKGVVATSKKTMIQDTTNGLAGVIAIILGLLGIIVAMNLIVIGTIFMVIMGERKKEMGVLRTIGLSAKDLSNVMFFEGGIIGFVGAFFGMTLSVLVVRGLSDTIKNLIRLPYSGVSSSEYVFVALIVIVLMTLTSAVSFVLGSMRQNKSEVAFLLREEV